LRHIEELLAHFQRSLHDHLTRDAILLSILFHDVIYDATKKDNEEKSAELFLEFAKEVGTIPGEIVTKVNQYILATKKHTEVPCDDPDQDLLLFLDCDLAILGAPRERYAEYARQIRNEYMHVPSPTFESARPAFLSDFLKIPRLYKTDLFHREFEAKARENVAWEIRYLTEPKRYDAILIPGGGSQRGASVDTLPEWTVRRLQRGLTVWREQRERFPDHTCYLLPLSAGTTHRPNYTGPSGVQVFEATSAGLWLLAHGVPKELVIREYSSYDTIGNAYFARTQHCEVANFKSLLVVTSAFHYPRTEEVFRWVFGLPSLYGSYHCDVTFFFESVSDDGIDAEVITARTKREQQSLISFRKNVLGGKGITDMRRLHKWLWSEHAAYATNESLVVGEGGAVVDEVMKKSY
jgi:predicted metal-dependent HD superfamily phosphohydrolase